MGIYRNSDVELLVLKKLREKPNKAVSRDDLLKAMYGGRKDGGPLHADRVLTSYIARLRQRGIRIVTLVGFGYRYVGRPRTGLRQQIDSPQKGDFGVPIPET